MNPLESPPMTVMIDRRFRPAPRVLCQEVHGEVVLLDLASERYFGLNEVGARAWALCSQGLTQGSVLEALEAEFEVSREQLEADLARLLTQLLEAGLLVEAP